VIPTKTSGTEAAKDSSQIQLCPEPRESAIPVQYGIASRLRSYFFFDPLIWLYTLVLGIISIPVSLMGRQKERVLHNFARFWSQLIMRTIQSPLTVKGLENADTSQPHVYAVNHASAMDIPILYTGFPFQFRIAFK